MKNELHLYAVSRIENGWIVDAAGHNGNDGRRVFCATWDEIEKVCRQEAFPFPNPFEPRGPAPFFAKFGPPAATTTEER